MFKQYKNRLRASRHWDKNISKRFLMTIWGKIAINTDQ